MFTAISIIIILVCVLLALAVLIQNSKGGGLAAGFSSSQQIMGVRKTTDFLEKFTWGLATTLIVLCILGNFMIPRNTTVEQKASSIQEQIDNATMPASQNAPLPGAQQQAQPAQQQPAPAK